MPRLKKKPAAKPVTKLGDVDPMTLQQLAQVLQCHPHTIRRHIDAGELECTRVGNRLRFYVEQVKAFLERQAEKNRNAVYAKKVNAS